MADWFGETHTTVAKPLVQNKTSAPILVPRDHDPFGLRQGWRPLAGTEAGSPRISDFRLLCAASEI